MIIMQDKQRNVNMFFYYLQISVTIHSCRNTKKPPQKDTAYKIP